MTYDASGHLVTTRDPRGTFPNCGKCDRDFRFTIGIRAAQPAWEAMPGVNNRNLMLELRYQEWIGQGLYA